MPAHRGSFSIGLCKRPNKIIQTDSMCKMPNTIRSSGTTNRVTAVTASATASSLKPRARLECESWEEMPEIKMNNPAKNGSAGIKKVSSSVPSGIRNKNAMV